MVGSGPAGLAAALAAADSGKSVLLLEQDALPGGSTLWEQQRIDDLPASEWRQRMLDRLGAHQNVHIRCNTLAFGHYDHGLVMALESHADGVDAISWRIRSFRSSGVLMVSSRYSIRKDKRPRTSTVFLEPWECFSPLRKHRYMLKFLPHPILLLWLKKD